MSTQVHFTPPKKKRTILWWLTGGFLLLVCLFLVDLFGPSPKLILSKQTTYITSPLRPDGMPDYGQYLLESSRNGVIPERNAAQLVWRAMGIGQIDANDRASFVAELGITENELLNDHPLDPAFSSKMHKRVAGWMNDQGLLTLPGQPIDPAALQQVLSGSYDYSNASPQCDQLNELVEATIGRASDAPWTSKQYPPIAEWVADNQAPLDLLVAASKRPQFYSPWPSLLHGEPSLAVALPLEADQAFREIARALPIRAMWHVGEGRPLEAWHDLLAIHRLANLCVGDTMFECMVAYAMSNSACKSTYALLGSTNLSADDARQILRDLSTLPPLHSLGDCVDRGERIFALDMMSHSAADGGGLSFLTDPTANASSKNLLNHITVDWNIVLTDMNFWFDRLAAALKTAGPVAQTVALQQVFADMQQAKADAWTASKLMTSVISRRQRSQLVATAVVDLLTASLQTVSDLKNRADTMLELARLGAALAVYHAEHNAYPEKLDELVPVILPKLPTDPNHGKQYLYHRIADGYLLYSTGENGNDDGGSNANVHIFEGYDTDDLGKLTPPQTPRIPDDADDIAIRVPQLRSLAIPAAPSAQER